MKIVFLHLSDMHFPSSNAYSNDNVNRIVATLQSHITDAAGVIIVCSGDLTQGGRKDECDNARSFLCELEGRIKDRYEVNRVEFLIVPGNHDNNFDISCYNSEELEDISRNNLFKDKLCIEEEKEQEILSICKERGCFKNDLLTDIVKFDFEGTILRFDLINSAPFSAKCQDEGFHFLDDNSLQMIGRKDEEAFSFVVVHHPYYFFTWDVKHILEENFINTKDAIFSGHDHYTKNSVTGNSSGNVKIIAAGALCNNGDWNNSEFSVGELETEDRHYQIIDYKLNSGSQIYEKAKTDSFIFSKKDNNPLGIQFNRKYLDDLCADKRYEVSKSVLDYFVFPLLEEEVQRTTTGTRSYQDENAFWNLLDKNRKVYISGASGSGRSTLAKYTLSHYLPTNITLFIHGDVIRGGNVKRLIKNAFEDEYSPDYSAYEQFDQCSSENITIVIDDANLADENTFAELIKYIGQRSWRVVCFSEIEIKFDLLERLKKETIMEGFTYLQISRFYSDKREKLIANIVNIVVVQTDSKERTIKQISNILKTHKELYTGSPDFIVQFVRYICDNTGISYNNDGYTFSKVFEHNITSLIEPLADGIKVDKYFIVLGMIAYQMHISPKENKKYPMSLDDMSSVINDYKEAYDTEIDTLKFLDVVTKANVLKRLQGGFIFSDSHYLAYFVAKEMKRQAEKTHDLSEFYRCLNCACFGVNADIVLFMTYMSDNQSIIKRILDKVEEYVDGWEEFTLSPCNVKYMSDAQEVRQPAVTESEREHISEMEVENEKNSQAELAQVDQESLYAYDENNISCQDELVRIVSLTLILARSLPSFEHLIEADVKRRCVKLVYSLPLKAFYNWAIQIDEDRDDIILEIKKILRDRRLSTLRDYQVKQVRIADFDALSLLRQESEILLMELMNGIISGASKGDAISHIDKYMTIDENNKPTYRIEHLMSVESRDDPQKFINECIGHYKIAKSPLEKNILKQVARHYLLTSSKISMPQMQRVNSIILDEQMSYNGLAAVRMKNKKR